MISNHISCTPFPTYNARTRLIGAVQFMHCLRTCLLVQPVDILGDHSLEESINL